MKDPYLTDYCGQEKAVAIFSLKHVTAVIIHKWYIFFKLLLYSDRAYVIWMQSDNLLK